MFITDKRDDGKSFVKLADDAPEWLEDAVRDAHHGTFPDDWIYAECKAAYDAFQENDGERPDDYEHADGRVDIYTKERYQWAADMRLTDLFSLAEGEAAEIYGRKDDVSERIGVVQYCAIRMIAASIWDAMDAQKEEEEERISKVMDGGEDDEDA